MLRVKHTLENPLGILTVVADTAAVREPTIGSFSFRVKTDGLFFS